MNTVRFSAAIMMVLAFSFALLLRETSALPRCRDHDLPAPTNCKYGAVRDWCRNMVCAKGPGESCGGQRMEEGTCGAGTWCSCNECVGCSTFDRTCHRGALMCNSR